MVGAGKAEGAIDAGNMLKPALARGELHCIGATTLDEYRKYIEKDAALERRFQKVLVDEPSVESTIAILRGLQENTSCTTASTSPTRPSSPRPSCRHRYITDRFLPDKAIDLIDEAAARIKMEIDSKPEVMDKLDRRMIQLKIEREAVKKEKDKASKKRCVDRGRGSPNWTSANTIPTSKKSGRPKIGGARRAQIKEEIDHLKADIARLHAKASWTRWPSCSTASCRSWKPAEGGREKAGDGEPKENKLLRTQVGAEEIAEVVSRAPPASRSAR